MISYGLRPIIWRWYGLQLCQIFRSFLRSDIRQALDLRILIFWKPRAPRLSMKNPFRRSWRAGVSGKDNFSKSSRNHSYWHRGTCLRSANRLRSIAVRISCPDVYIDHRFQKCGKQSWSYRARAAGLSLVTTEMLLFEWLRRAGTDEFRFVLPIIRDL